MKGECLCGAVEFEAKNFSGNIYHCHCTLCRKQSGSTSNSGAVVDKNDFSWIKGEKHIETWVKETGFISSFCKLCGSPVPNQLRKLDFVWLPVGCFEDGNYKVVANICLSDKAQWSTVADEGARYEAMPEINSFIASLSEGIHA